MAGKYHVTACGAAGGNGTSGSRGGRGALVNRTVQLQRGESLQLVIGQLGMTKDPNAMGSGGGGTFIVLNENPLVIAGGGGGGGLSTDGGDGRSDCGIKAGLGGEVCVTNHAVSGPGGGGGFLHGGMCFQSSPCVNKECKNGGQSFRNGGRGGVSKSLYQNCDGGFGGGGSCGNAPGGGGGYAGGKVTLYNNNNTRYTYGEGGCSYALPDGLVTTAYNNSDGYAIIKLMP